MKFSNLAARVNLDYKDKNPLLIGVLNGCFMFAADFIKAPDIPCEVAFIHLSSYEGLEKTPDIKYKGFEVPNGFVVGYGLDYDGRGRNLKDIYQLKLP